MFGTLKPHACAMPQGTRKEYAQFYCGLCKSLGDGYGQVSRVLVSHDAVFLAVLVDALTEEPAKESSCRCPMLPVVHRPTVEPESTGLKFARSVQVLLAEQWLADRAVEGKRLAQWGQSLARSYVRAARASLDELGVDLSSLASFEQVQASVEQQVEATPQAAAAPTQWALGVVFESIASLPGATDACRQTETRAALSELGAAVGGLIYWLDALEDLRKDYLAGDFNPGLRGSSPRDVRALVVCPDRVEVMAGLVSESIQQVRQSLRALPLRRHQAVLHNILYHELPRSARRAIATARQTAERSERERLAVLRAMSIPRRAMHAVALAFAFVFTWLWSLRPSFAQVADGAVDRLNQDAAGGGGAGGAGAGGDATGASGGTAADEEEEEGIGGQNDDFYDEVDGQGGGGRGKPFFGPGGVVECPACGACSKCACCDPGAICNDCCNGICNECTKPCKGCCEPCSDCANCCNGGCPCDGCCKGGGCPCDGCCKGGGCPCQ